jgi:hypothetical protein
VLELLLDQKPALSLPHIAEVWTDNLLRPHDASGSN